MAANLSLWPCIVDSAALASPNETATCMPGTTGKGGLFHSLDLFQSNQRPHVDELEQSLMTCDQILPMLNGSPAPSTELFQLLQQQQLDDVESSLLEEQRIDAQIEQLLQMKAQMLAVKQFQQPGILEDAAVQTPFAPLAVSSGVTTVCAPLALDSSFLSPSATIDVGQDWSWLTGTTSTAAPAVAPPYNPARHSIDLGGLALRMAACELNPNNSFTLQTSGVNQTPLANNTSALQPGDVPAFGAALSPVTHFATHAPLITPGSAAASAALAAPSGSLPLPGAHNAYLQSALFMPAQLSGTSRTPGLDVQSPAVFTVMAPQPPPARARSSRTRRMSLDLHSQKGLYNSPAAVTGRAFNSFTTGAVPTQAGWPRGTICNASSVNDNEPRRASVDFPISSTPPLSRDLPKEFNSMLNPSATCTSARNSPINNTQQQTGGFTGVSGQAVKAPGCRYNAHQAPAHQAPKWAGSQWNPMADIVKNGQQAAKGTGVFIPGGGFAEPCCVDTKAT